jgi:SAM-dependent methyltransferase
VDGSRTVTAVDLSAPCVAALRARFPVPTFRARVGDITDPRLAAELATERFDTALCVNVLEHIRCDDAALRHLAEILAPARGRLLLLVPAHPFLFGTPDRLAGHHRRYSRGALRGLLRRAGFSVERLGFFNATGVLPYLFTSRVLRPRTLGGIVDAQLLWYDRWCVPAARRVEAVLRPPFGQSLIAIAQRGVPAR